MTFCELEDLGCRGVFSKEVADTRGTFWKNYPGIMLVKSLLGKLTKNDPRPAWNKIGKAYAKLGTSYETTDGSGSRSQLQVQFQPGNDGNSRIPPNEL